MGAKENLAVIREGLRLALYRYQNPSFLDRASDDASQARHKESLREIATAKMNARKERHDIRMQDPAYRAKFREAQIERLNDPIKRARLNEMARKSRAKRMQDPAYREKIRAQRRAWLNDPEIRERRRAAERKRYLKKKELQRAEVAQLAEQQLSKLGVAGSRPAFRSINSEDDNE